VHFVSETDLSAAIRRVVAGDDVRCAVAFWGKGAAEELGFSGRPGKTRPRIVCDISMGGTNATELRELGAPRNSRLVHREGLHSKVYVSKSGAVICSANASNRGVGFQAAEARLIEAGVLVDFDTSPGSVWADAAAWFDRLWEGGNPVDNRALKRAEELWSKRQSAALRGGLPAGEAPTRTSLLELVRSNPRLFDGIGFVFASTRLPTAEKAERLLRDREDLPTRGGAGLEQFTDWGKDFDRWPEFFFEVWKPRDQISLYWRRKRVALPLDDPDTLYAETLAWRDMGPLGEMLLPQAAIIRKDEPAIRGIFESRDSRLFANGTELAKALNKLK
jgi:hypothetical protein